MRLQQLRQWVRSTATSKRENLQSENIPSSAAHSYEPPVTHSHAPQVTHSRPVSQTASPVTHPRPVSQTAGVSAPCFSFIKDICHNSYSDIHVQILQRSFLIEDERKLAVLKVWDGTKPTEWLNEPDWDGFRTEIYKESMVTQLKNYSVNLVAYKQHAVHARQLRLGAIYTFSGTSYCLLTSDDPRCTLQNYVCKVLNYSQLGLSTMCDQISMVVVGV